MHARLELSSPAMTSSLNEVVNDTGRIGFCGPYVISAITGHPLSRVEELIQSARTSPAKGAIVRGTTTDDVRAALSAFGYQMTLLADYTNLERKERPSVWSWMQKPRNVWTHYLLAITKGKEGHWVLIKGVKLCDTFSQGKWQFVCDGPHKGAKILEIYEVRREL